MEDSTSGSPRLHGYPYYYRYTDWGIIGYPMMLNFVAGLIGACADSLASFRTKQGCAIVYLSGCISSPE